MSTFAIIAGCIVGVSIALLLLLVYTIGHMRGCPAGDARYARSGSLHVADTIQISSRPMFARDAATSRATVATARTSSIGVLRG